ncbi:MAG: DUF1579 domain-containing protein [Chitinophagaceae bacterium]
MKKITLTICTAAFLLFACNSDKKTDEGKTDKDKMSGTGEKMDEKMDEKMPMMDSATMMKNWMSYMSAGEMHALLANCEGYWNADIIMWDAPGAPPNKSTGAAVNKMIMGGRYLEGTNSGNMMGMPFEGRSITAYDNGKKVFINSWIDNMGTGIMNMEGTWDDASKSINFKGKGMNPMTMKECDYRETFKMVDDNTQMMEMFGPSPADGKEMKMMEIIFTRKK